VFIVITLAYINIMLQNPTYLNIIELILNETIGPIPKDDLTIPCPCPTMFCTDE